MTDAVFAIAKFGLIAVPIIIAVIIIFQVFSIMKGKNFHHGVVQLIVGSLGLLVILYVGYSVIGQVENELYGYNVSSSNDWGLWVTEKEYEQQSKPIKISKPPKFEEPPDVIEQEMVEYNQFMEDNNTEDTSLEDSSLLDTGSLLE